jgi:hypothetical protein
MDIDELSYYYRVLNAYTYIEILKGGIAMKGCFSSQPERLDALKTHERAMRSPMRWASSQWSPIDGVLCSLKTVQCSGTESVRGINILQHESIGIGGESLEIGGGNHSFRGRNHSFGGNCPQGERHYSGSARSPLGHCFCGKSTNLLISLSIRPSTHSFWGPPGKALSSLPF